MNVFETKEDIRAAFADMRGVDVSRVSIRPYARKLSRAESGKSIMMCGIDEAVFVTHHTSPNTKQLKGIWASATASFSYTEELEAEGDSFLYRYVTNEICSIRSNKTFEAPDGAKHSITVQEDLTRFVGFANIITVDTPTIIYGYRLGVV